MLTHTTLFLNVCLWIGAAFYLLACLLNGYRVLIGPSLPDRIAALDTLSINAIGLIILLCIALQTRLYMDVAILLAMFGFISTAAICKYVLRGFIIE
ncbi:MULTISPECIES: monovalent cation/H+ antiporter complex subunit F [Zymobacter]|uniref:Multisubunit Na+/H+ antiporter, MnhF subunit n=1 Tax=Zymobacter palmae TaxID=33074 RepID=A0A348HGT2_9GAMM|nr:monovalent cation/H+ antiporter complex subunit F [Zymobacter palmae]BBG30834.1 multisubunit Na+/H+ antiporter, MnhF subunit [Zymobacter palmae]